MPKVKRNRKPPPEGWELIEPTLDELEAKMKEGTMLFVERVFFTFIFHFAGKQSRILQNGLQIQTPRPRFPVMGQFFKLKNAPLILTR